MLIHVREPLKVHRQRQLDAAISRRDLGKYVATMAALSGISASNAAAQTRESTPESSSDRPRGGSVTLAQVSIPATFDPHLTLDFSAICIYNNIFDTLVGIGADRQIEGILAESWDISEDETEYTFRLREGIRFHDGSEFNADAVKFSYDRVLSPETNSPGAARLVALKETIVIDPLTVKLVLHEPYAPFLTYLSASYYGGAIVPPGAVQEMGDDFGFHPIGTGPWKFKEYVSGERVIMERNDEYRNVRSYVENTGAPYLDELAVAFIPSNETTVLAFETGEIQVMSIPSSEVSHFQENPDYEVVISPASTAITFLEFAMEPIEPGTFGAWWKAPFDDLRVRQAVALALDIDGVVENVLYGLATRLYGSMESGLFAYRPDIEEFGYHFDPEQAKALLDGAGWIDTDGDGVREKDGERFDVLLWTKAEDPLPKIAQFFQNQLGQVGIAVSIEVLDTAAFIASVVDGPANLSLTGRGSPDPDYMRALIDSDQNLFTYYHDEEYLALVDEANVVSDQARRTELYFEAQKKVLADCAWISLYSKLGSMGVRDAKGFKTIPLSENVYCHEDMYIEE